MDAVTVTAARGFIASGIVAGLKQPADLDLALVVAEQGEVAAAGMFTTNAAAAAPVQLTRDRIASGRTRAVILNSGCANAGTGSSGMADAERVTAGVAALLGTSPPAVLMCSTGPIGPRLPVVSIERSLTRLVESLDRDGGATAAAAILTTDSGPKTSVIDGDGFVVGGMAKGAGMLRPDLATMLCVLTTDAAVEADALQMALATAVPPTFNSLNIDGCESTNDTVLLLASGAAGPVPAARVAAAVEEACRNLALQLAADAEGATRVVRLMVSGATDDAAARRYGKAVADSALVRASFFGGDPNWGRILAALGTCGLDPAVLTVAYEGQRVAEAGVGVDHDDHEIAKLLTGDFRVEIGLGKGPGRAEILTTDLTPDYARLNGARS
jgi:glutamate N-acetyltransferase/amino-acid N-acetyltransferase